MAGSPAAPAPGGRAVSGRRGSSVRRWAKRIGIGLLALMAEGRSNAAIAHDLVVGDGAVEKHIRNVFMKLDLPPSDEDHRRVLAVLAWLRGAG